MFDFLHKPSKEQALKELENLKKAYEFLEERYQKKTITIEQFAKQCEDINKKKEKYQKMLDKYN